MTLVIKSQIEIPPPDYVSELTIENCRNLVESRIKKIARSILLPYIKWQYSTEELGEGFQWGKSIRIGSNSRIGRYVYIGTGFESIGPISVGDLTMISTECKIIGADHLYNIIGTPTRLAFSPTRKVTTFGADVWIGKRAIIKEGVLIGRGAVVGSGALVTTDIPPYSVVAGIPARILKVRFSEAEISSHESKIFDV